LIHFHTNFKLQKGNLQQFQNRPNVLYRFKFISLISPYLLTDLRLLTVTSTPSTYKKAVILMKQSYLLFTWFYYMKESNVNKDIKKVKQIKFSCLPVKRSMYTLTKAPMAHKTNSKEQFVFRFFKFSISMKTYYNLSNNPSSVNNGLISLLLIRKAFPVFETNILLLKNYSIYVRVSDANFFSFFLISNNYGKFFFAFQLLSYSTLFLKFNFFLYTILRNLYFHHYTLFNC
jgi:hypothetical protein